MLTFDKVVEQHDLSIRELQRIVMRPRLIHVDLPKPRHGVRDHQVR
jgi:hypothetical protein